MRKVIEVKKVGEGQERPLPAFATPGSAGLDLRAAIQKPLILPPGGRQLVPSGLAINIGNPEIVGIVASRSGLSLKHGIRVAQGIGVIDSDYHGEIGVILANDGREPYTVFPGDRIAQLLFMPVVLVDFQLVEGFGGETARGEGGFGHTGNS